MFGKKMLKLLAFKAWAHPTFGIPHGC